MTEEKPRLLGKQIWCLTCLSERPRIIRHADFLIPVRALPYDLYEDESDINKDVNGVCSDCLEKKGWFQRENTESVDLNHEHLICRQM